MNNRENELNLIITEPPLKRFKKQLEEKFELVSKIPSNIILPVDTSFIASDPVIGSPKESNLEKWRKSFQSSSNVSIPQMNLESGMKEIELLSDSFFSDPPEGNEQNEFDFNFEGISEIDNYEESSRFESIEPYHRVKIMKIHESFYVIEGQKFQYPEKILECLLIKNDSSVIDFAPIKVLIRGDWLFCALKEDNFINIIGPIKNGEIFINDELNYLVVEPDILINNTAIADSFSCMRKAVIAYRTSAALEDNKPSTSLICGSIVHELVEEAFKTGKYREIKENDKRLNELIQKQIEKIFCCEKDEKFVREKVLEIMKTFPKWCQLYLRKVPAIHAYVQDPIRKGGNNKEKTNICITKVLDLEESIWSAMFGLKGKIDATVVAKSRNSSSSSESVLTPFELKTGQSTTSVSHRAQTLLYTLLLFDRYKRPIDYGLLFYISSGDLLRMPSFRDEIKSILIKRNLLAQELVKTNQFPDQIRNEHLCKQCNHVNSCVMLHKLHEKGTIETSSVPKIFEQKTEHFLQDGRDSEYEQFFGKWFELINLEEEESIKTRSELWRFDSMKRSNRGKCLNEMKLISCDEISGNSDMYRYICLFKKRKEMSQVDELKVSLLNSYLNEKDPVIISCDDPLSYALASGVVKSVTSDLIYIYTDRPVKILDTSSLDTTELDGNNCTGTLVKNDKLTSLASFCIDKNELTGVFGLMRTNMIKLFSGECKKLMDLVVNQKTPTYLPRVKFDENILEEYGLLDEYRKMDSDQKESFFRSIETRDYLLILGMPGTGKTTTLAFIIRYLVLVLGKSILITSHTHSAIDHIALKLQERNFPFLRLGNGDKIDKLIDSKNVLENHKFTTVSDVEHCYSNARVVISTSYGMNHSIFMRKRFDFCLVDEASQLTLPACIGTLKVAQAFILVGDHYQLPPLVRSQEALKRGLGDSLFKILAEAHPQSMVKLCNQYRMNDEIMLMANRLTYQNLLKCGSSLISKQTLEINLNSSGDKNDLWLEKIFDPKCKVAFLNTDPIEDAYEVVNGYSFHNEKEAEIIKMIVSFALKNGIKENQISLISPYRPQLKYLKCFDVTVSTIDKFQGKDSDFVIISLVRSNSTGYIGELLNDWKRLNVAFTRARKKLLLVGSAGTVLGNPSFKKLKDLVEERNWLIDYQK